MEIIYANNKVKKQCTDVKVADRLFGGKHDLSVELFSRIHELEQAMVIKDIIVQKNFHFHKLSHKKGRNLEGYFAIDVKSRKNPWRIIFELLDDAKEVCEEIRIDKVASSIRIIKIKEVSKHYE